MVKQQPRWFAKMYAEVWGRRLDPGTGLQVLPLPSETPENCRYAEYLSVAQAELATVQYFSNGNISEEGENARLFRGLFPEGLGAEIEALLREDAARLADKERVASIPQIPHTSFTANGCSGEEALKFQARGWSTLYDVPPKLTVISEVIDNAAKALRLVALIEAGPQSAKAVGEAIPALAPTKPPTAKNRPFPAPASASTAS
jgi:hypothetical protein